MALPTPDPITDLATLKAYLQITDTRDDTRLERIRVAVNAYVRGLPVAEKADGLEAWPANITEGATMVAGRLWMRKDSPSGVSVMGEGAVVYAARRDPDVALLLDLGEHAAPSIG